MIVAGQLFYSFLKILFDTKLGKQLALGALLFSVVCGYLVSRDNGVRARQLSEINQKGKALADEAVKAGAPALRPGSAERLRANSCRDC